MVVKAFSLLFLLLLLLSAVPSTVAAQAPPDERTRVGVLGTSEEDQQLLRRLLGSAVNILASSHPEALFVDARGLLVEGEPDLERAEAQILDLLLHLRVRTSGADEEGNLITAELYDVRGRQQIASLEQQVVVERLGRYLRSRSWEELVAELSGPIQRFRPFSILTVRTEPGATVSFGAELLGAADSRGILEAELRNMRNYELRSSREGYRSEETTVFLRREPLEVTIDLQRYPVWMVELGVIGLSSPVIGAGRFVRDTQLYLSGEINTRLVTFTPLRGTNLAYDDDWRLFSNTPVSELSAAGDLYLRGRDTLLRPYLGGQLTGRFHHGEEQFGFDPVLPASFALRGGGQLELSERFYLSSRIESRFYFIAAESFLAGYPFHYRFGATPILWNPALLYLGGRFAL
ncbi:MAG: hypothetical protein ACOCWS_00185 [Alkalispirochaetaceae bacterium]